MLQKLFISKVRIKILKKYFFDDEKEYHVRGLVRLLEEEINAIRRELQNLETAGLLISQQKGNKLFYRLNEKSPILEELKSMMFKDREDIKTMIEHLSKLEKIECAVLTENYLRDHHETAYDIDILFVGDESATTLTAEMKKLEAEIGKTLRFSLLKRADLEFQKKRRDPFLLNILEKDKIILIGSDRLLM